MALELTEDQVRDLAREILVFEDRPGYAPALDSSRHSTS